MRSDRQPFKYMLSLIEKLKQVKDFRKDKGKRHPLWIVLVVIILGTMLGYSGYRELGEFAKNNRHRLSKEFNISPERVPSYSTIRRVMMGVEWQSLLKVFNEWALEDKHIHSKIFFTSVSVLILLTSNLWFNGSVILPLLHIVEPHTFK